ncbi:CENP-meta isoform 2-T2 [Cochliomyia hominivorax]
MSTGKNSVQVAIKVRPLFRKEKDQVSWRVVDNSIQLADSQTDPYYFDHIFDQDATNQDIFDKMAKQIVHSAIQGFNGTIFAYGQTSSGKTYTMMGDDDNPGVMVLAAKEIFKEIEKTQDRQFLLRVCYIEIYNEKIYDLLNKKNQDLKIHETSTGIVGVNCEECIIRSEDDLLSHLRKGSKERTVGETNMNERSSRSHAIFRVIIESQKIDRSEDDAVTQSVINLVDLAGSERADQTGARGTRLKEGGHINKSLLFLSNVIKRLSENDDDKYVNYRDSKLTRILQASLGGNALTAIICTIKPNAIEETQSTLNFALRAKAIKNKPQVNEIVTEATMMKRLQREVNVLKNLLKEEQRKNESQIKVRQLEQRIKDEDLKIISCNSLHTIRSREKRRRTWCPSSTNLDASTVNQQPSALPVPAIGSHLMSALPQPSRLQAPKASYYNTPLITMRPPAEPPAAPKLGGSGLPIPPDNLPEIDEEFAPAEMVNFEMLSPLQTPRNQHLQRNLSVTPKIIGASPRSKCDEFQIQVSKLTNANKLANEKIAKYEAELAELKKTNEKLEMENREAVNLDFEFQRHKTKSKLRETELLEALNEKEKEITKLEKSLNSLSAERLQNSKEELFQKSHIQDTNIEVCVKCEDLQRLLEENKKVCLEFEKLTLEYENLKLNYTEIEKENDTNKLKIKQLEEVQEKEKEECEKLLVEVQELREKLQQVQKDYEQLSSENSSKHEECIALNSEVEEARKAMVVLEEKFSKLEISWQEQQQTLSDIEAQYAVIQTKYEQLNKQYEQLETTKDQSQTDCQRLEQENVELQNEIEELKKKVQDAQQKLLESNEKYEETTKETKTAKEELTAETSKIQQENEQLKQQLLEIQTQFEDLQKEYDDLSNQLMDNLQESESLKSENTKLQKRLNEFEEKNEEVVKAEAELNELKSQLQNVLSNERNKVLKTPSPGRNSSMRSSGVCCTAEEEERDFEQEFLPQQDLLTRFSELSESLMEIELEHSKGKSKVFRTASKNSTPNSYKMYLKNIMGVSRVQKGFDMEIENIHLQGSFKHHSFHIVEMSGEEDKSCNMECDTTDINGCDNVAEYIEKLKQEIYELKTTIEQERLSNKSLIDSTEKAFSEMREQITQLSAELMEKSIFVENCACKTYQQQIENLEKEKADITIMCEELQEKVNCTLNGSFNMLMNSTAPPAEVKALTEEKLKELEELRQREQEFESQTKTLEELTQRYIDMETELETVREQMETQEKEYKEKHNQLQLEILQKLELSASEYRDNMKKYNKEWEERKEEYEQTIKDLQQQIQELKDLQETHKEEKELDKMEIENTTEDAKMLEDFETIKQDKIRIEEQNEKLQQQLNTAEEHLENLKQENRTQYEKIVSLEEHLSATQSLQETLSKEKLTLETQVKNLEKDLDCIPKLHEKNHQLTSELEKLNLEFQQIQEKLEQAELKIQDFSQKDNQHQELIQTNRSQLNAVEEEKNCLTNELKNLKEEHFQTQEKLQKAERQIEEFCSEDAQREELIQMLQNKLQTAGTLEEENRNLVNECKQLKDSLNDLKQNETASSQKIESLQQQVNELNEILTDIKVEKTNLEDKLQQINNEYNLLKTEHLSLEAQLRELSEERNSLNEQCTQLKEERVMLQEQLQCLKEKEKSEELLQEIVREKAELVQNLRLTTEKLENSLQQLEEREKEILKSKEENAQIQQELQTLQVSLEEKQLSWLEMQQEKDKSQEINKQLQQDLENLQQNYDQVYKEAQQEKEKHEQETAEFKDKLTKLNQEKQDQQKTLEDNQQEFGKLQQKLEKLKDTLSQTIQDKQQEFHDMENRYLKTQKQNQELQQQLEELTQTLGTSNQQQLQQMEKFKQENSLLQEQVNKLQHENQEQQQNLEKSQKDYLNQTQLLSNNLEAKQQEFNSLENNYLNSQKQNQELQLQLKELTQTLSTLQQQQQQQLESNEQLQDLLKTTKETLSQMHEEKQKHLQQINENLEQQTKLKLLKETLEANFSSLQNEYQDLKLKFDSLQVTNTQLQNHNQQLERQLHETLEKLKHSEMLQEELAVLKLQNNELQQSLKSSLATQEELNLMKVQNNQLQQSLKASETLQDEFNILKVQNNELQHNLKATVEEAGRCSLALRQDVEHHKQLLEKQSESYNTLKNEMEIKQNFLKEENVKLSSTIETLQNEKLSLEEKLREITIRNFEQDLQRQAIDATANTSMDSNTSTYSPRGRRSLERRGADSGEIKSANISIEEKLCAIQQKNSTTAERKNRRLSTHDERRRQSYWGAAHDKETMTEPMDISCNCIELDRKLKECERNLFIKNSQVTALNMELKNHPLKDENAALMKRLQEEQDKHRIEIKRYKNKLYEQTAKAEKAIAAAAHATAKSQHVAANAAMAAEQQVSNPVLPKVVANVEIQTDDELSSSIHKLQGKYNDLKNICRYRYNVIKELEEKMAQKENSDGNSVTALEAAQYKVLNNQCDSLKKELATIKEKYEHAKKVLLLRRDEIAKLRGQLEQVSQ